MDLTSFKSLGSTIRRKLSSSLRGSLVIVAFSESGSVRRFTLSKKLAGTLALVLTLLCLFSTYVFFKNFQFLFRNARIAYLEEENSSLAARLQGQLEQIDELKKEIAELKDFETKLRSISGLSPASSAVVGTGEGGERPSRFVSGLKK
jgi:hypothetical protein